MSEEPPVTSVGDPGAPVVELFEDPAAFLAVAEHVLGADPVLTTVMATVTRRAVEHGGVVSSGPVWWAAVRASPGEGAPVIGVAMRTLPVPPYWLYVLPMPPEAARALARALHARGEEVTAVNGAAPAARDLAEELARLNGGVVRVEEHVRLHLLGDLLEPAPVPGRLRVADQRDLALALEWFAAFEGDAARQAGREPQPTPPELIDVDAMRQRIAQGRVWLWEDEQGRVVHLSAANPPAFGVARVGPVYTPAEQRGRGWASNAVAEVARMLRAQGHEVCLFTDQANPTSNRIYAALGFRPVVDMENLRIERQPR
ncbi:GNAT family N-acetyltransferase [Nocardioides sp. dk4132]|uniref:GNAT family N-acetyltransferase n=1 Tax=unclassified Nocardioides TaxID=2615069 RepID=UPI001295AC14|nr:MULTISPECIES: GNAT family N-acetyltransferase [unclassified Nocardioides]MQW76629.1 GNAT family N-acetyltransferase [Nocardioides sp. dk4132]QGA07002.1 GNAT family N-acetyltransferase [Nocardioides sp. dk884]